MASVPERSAILEQLERVVRSRALARADRLCRFLKFVTGYALEGRSDELKEYLLATQVYGRKDSFDPKTDAIVRVEATRLRERLREYFDNEGAADPIVFELPKGSYVPVFKAREAAAAAAPKPAPSIAVLPFLNMSADPENEYFSDGLTEEIINALTRIEGLRVVARTSVFQYKGRADDVRRIGAELGAANILEGSVRRAGDRIRVAAQLIEVATGYHLWSEVFEHRLKDIFAIQDEITHQVVGYMRVTLTGAPAPAPAKVDRMEAYNLYLKGRHEWNLRTADALWRAIGCFEEALRIKPDYAPAYAGLADSYALLGVDTMAPPEEVLPKAKAAAQRALDLDPSLAEVYVSLGLSTGLLDRDWDATERHLLRALELNPGSATAQYIYGAYLAVRGRLDEAMGPAIEALSLDPMSVSINRFMAGLFLYRREFDLALQQCRKTIDLDPRQTLSYVFLGRTYLARGACEVALSAFQKARELSGDHPFVLGWIGHTLARLGEHGEARRLLAEIQAANDGKFLPLLAPMFVHLGLGDSAAALAGLRSAAERHYGYLVNLCVDPVFDEIRHRKEFLEVARLMGLNAETAAASV